MKLTHGIAALVMMASAAAAHAEFTGTLAATTDYNWRGITQTAQDPALQGSLDFSTEMGLHGGAWASNVDFGGGDPNVEIDLYAGWGGGETFPWDVGVVYYTYPGASDLNFTEFYGSLGWEWITGKISYSYNFGGYAGAQAFYYEATSITRCRPTSACSAISATATATASRPRMARTTTSTGRPASATRGTTSTSR